MAVPGRTPILSKLFAMAFAAICVVPNMAIILTVSTRPSWKMLFSMPFGIPICRICFIIRIFTPLVVPIRMSSFGSLSLHIRMKQAIIREISDAPAAPATLQWNPKINSASPITLITFMIIDACMDIFEFPIDLNSAAQELYTAKNG